MLEIQGQILVLAFRSKHSKPFRLFPLPSETGKVFYRKASGDTTPSKFTPVILHGGVSPDRSDFTQQAWRSCSLFPRRREQGILP